MAVRTAYAPVAGTAITAANHAKFPGGWIGYAETTTAQTGIAAGPTDLTSLSVTVTVGTSRRITIQGSTGIQQITSTGLGDLQIRNGSGTVLNRARVSTTATSIGQLECTSVQTPSSGSNTYKLSLGTSAGTIDTVAASTNPAFILVQDIGPSS
jgi:hypothetical protein